MFRSLEPATLWALTLASLGGCNLANYEGQRIEEIVEIEDVSETLRVERAELDPGSGGWFRPLVHQEFDVEREEVKRREVTRNVHETGPVNWVLMEALGDPLLAANAVLDILFLPLRDENGTRMKWESLPGWPLVGVAAVLPGITYAPLPKETRVGTSSSVISRRPAEAAHRKVLVKEGLHVFVGEQLVEADGGLVRLRDACDASFRSGVAPAVWIEVDGRRHEVRVGEEEAAFASAALEERDLPWARALDFHTILFSLPPGATTARESLLEARDAGDVRWMAPMARDEWEVVARGKRVRMADGALVDFRAPAREGEGASMPGTPPERLTLTLGFPDEVPAGEGYGVQVSVENETDEAAHQLVAVLEGPGFGLLNVPVGAVMPGATVTRFVQLPARDGAPLPIRTAGLEQWSSGCRR